MTTTETRPTRTAGMTETDLARWVADGGERIRVLLLGWMPARYDSARHVWTIWTGADWAVAGR